MKGNQKQIFPFIMVLQIFIISFAVMAISAAAVPDLPIVLQGSVELDGEPAPVDTEISVELNGVEIATVMVTTEGEYSNLPVSGLSEDPSYINFYVNGIKARLVDATVLENVAIGDVLKDVDLIATSPVDDGIVDDGTVDDGTVDDGTVDDGTVDDGTVDDGTVDDGTVDDGTVDDGDHGTTRIGGSSGSYIIKATTNTSDEEIPSGFTASTTDDTSLKSVTTQPTELTEEEVPASETGSSMMIIVIGAIVLIGIVATVRYKLKEN